MKFVKEKAFPKHVRFIFCSKWFCSFLKIFTANIAHFRIYIFKISSRHLIKSHISSKGLSWIHSSFHIIFFSVNIIFVKTTNCPYHPMVHRYWYMHTNVRWVFIFFFIKKIKRRRVINPLMKVEIKCFMKEVKQTWIFGYANC